VIRDFIFFTICLKVVSVMFVGGTALTNVEILVSQGSNQLSHELI